MTGYDSWFDGEQAPASDVVAARRASMQTELLGAVRGRRRRQQAVRATLGTALVAAAVWLGFGIVSTDAPSSTVQPTVEAGPPVENFDFAVIEGTPDVPADWTVRDQSLRSEWLVGEDQAVDLLRESGVRAGFLRVRGELSVTGSIEPTPTED